jgi:predicted naringenin-chalcone synthase
MWLSSFQLARPRFEGGQDDFLAWLVEAHTKAAVAASDDPRTFDAKAFEARMRRLVRHVCCGSDRIATRGYSAPAEPSDGALALDDLTSRSPSGPGTAARTDWFAREVEDAFARLYEHEVEPPDDLVHVTCTGYVSPSGAQRLVARRGWGERTRVTHAYHMGCYASVPALRIARAFGSARTDVVHTELCSLHFDPSIHTPEQLVVQSLFADGSIRYTMTEARDGRGPAFRILALHEMTGGGAEDAMTWRLGDHGMRMSLSRDVPDTIGRTIRPFVGALFARGGLDFGAERATATFAIHPGGPRIIDTVRDALELREDQVACARRVLRRYGNMSSATLPHVWSDLLAGDTPPGSVVASFAFGPGLTIAGALFRKE